MTEAQAVGVIEHAAELMRPKLSDEIRDAIILQVRGYQHKGIAAELGISPIAARQRTSRGWRKLSRYPWKEWEVQQLVAVAEKIIVRQLGETPIEHAEGLWEATRNSRQVTPPTPTYDSNGRVVGGRDAQVSVDDILRLILGWGGMKLIF